MYPVSSLGEFLRSRRARIQPADVGLNDGIRRRRVPGLRREELALLAGVSVGYYTRLEQGQSPNVSDEVLDAIARVLRVDGEERLHLYRLARPGSLTRSQAEPERLRPSLKTMIESFGDVPAMVVGRRADILAWNRMGHALAGWTIDFDAPQRRDPAANFVRQDFTDPAIRGLYVDWEVKAADTVGFLQVSAGQFPEDPGFAELVAEMTRASTEFAALWSAGPITNCATSVRRYRHPVAGELTLTNEFLRLPDDPGLGVAIFNAEPGSESAAGLARLAESIRSLA